MSHEDESTSRFVVDLGAVKLLPVVARQVEAEIQAVVLRALAASESSGSQGLRRRRIWTEFPGQVAGLWIGDKLPDPPLSPLFGSGDPAALTVADHTLIMNAVMTHPMQVVRRLPDRHKTKGARPSGREVLQAALQVEQIDDYIKHRIQLVLDALPKIEAALSAAPESFKRGQEQLRQELANKTVGDKIRVLRDADARSRHKDDGLASGMELAAQILEDGRDSIYSADHAFYKLLHDGGRSPASPGSGSIASTVGDIADVDGVVGAAGAGIGVVVGSPGGPAGSGLAGGLGAAIGAAGGSAGAAIAAFIDWLW